jgi:indole-3-glycerol phosphate synthase
MNFHTILEDCRKDYVPFDRDVSCKRRPKDFKDARDVHDPGAIAREMVAGGACGISVLTEERYFKGSLDNLEKVARMVDVPVLRKDFIFDIAQVKEAYHYGADSILLISSFFESEGLEAMIEECRRYGMEPLVEIHSLEDGKTATEAGAEIFMVNNRDKDTLELDLERSRTLSEGLDGTIIGASGISNVIDMKYVLKYCDAVLVGTSIMASANIKDAVEVLVNA